MKFWQHRQDIGITLLAVLAMAALISAVILAFQGKAAEGALCAAMGLLLLAFVQLSRFKRFRGLGFEAELWETKQEEAALLVDQTRQLLGVLAKTTLTAAPRMNRMMTGFTRREILDLSDQVERLLIAAKAPTADLKSEIDRLISVDMAIPIANQVSQRVRTRVEQRRRAVAERFGSPITDSAGYGEALKAEVYAVASHAFEWNELGEDRKAWPDAIRRRIQSLEGFDAAERVALASEVEDRLLDLEAWTTNRSIRRTDIFFSESHTDAE
jgi:hypothetical protein